jgi:molybdate/tungstate transport system ATP-binding protein
MIELFDYSVEAGTFKLTGINLVVPTGKYCILLGKTGSGKTTIMESICGLKKSKGGTILINNENVTDKRPAERGIGFVPQDGALFSTMSVYNNIIFSLKLRKWTIVEMDNRVKELSELLKIENILKRSVDNLSGGERQRVSLARALAFFPEVLCLDEPLSALDQETHKEICDMLKKVQHFTNTTILHITHNPIEVELLSDLTYQIQSSEVKLIYDRSQPKTEDIKL